MRLLDKLLAAAVAIALAIVIAAAPASAAVVTRNGQGYQNPASTQTNPVAINGDFGSPHKHAVISTIPVANGDSATSIYNVGYVPTNAVLDPTASFVYATGIAGLTSVSCGFGAIPQPASIQLGGWAAQPAALVSAQDWHTAASFSLMQAVSVANYGLQVWQLIGLTATNITQDPGGVVPIFCTVNNATSAAGTLQFFLQYYNKY